jgi:DNA-directed RNA polymerase subunit M/transcription elongation factor TFIIS
MKFGGAYKTECPKCGSKEFEFERESRTIMQKGSGGSVSIKYKVCKGCGKRWNVGF